MIRSTERLGWTLRTLLALGLLLPVSPARADYSQWSWSRDIVLNASPTGADVVADLHGFPLLISLGQAEADVFTQSPTHADLRFAKPDGTPLPFQVESWDATARKAAIWVKLDTLKGGRTDQRIRMHWGRPGAQDSSSGKAVFTAAAGFRGVWHMEADLADASPNAIAAVDSGTSPEPGRIGAARGFNNPEAYATTGKYLALGNPASLNLGGVITMEAWIKWTRRDGHRIILCHGAHFGAAAGSAFETVLRVGETKDYRAGVWTGTAHYATLAAPAADSNAWIHLAGVYTGTTWALYRNGAKVAETGPDTNGAKPSQGAWRIGAEYANSVTRFFHGAIDEVRISDVARGADWIRTEYQNQKDGQTLVAIGPSVPTAITSRANRGNPRQGATPAPSAVMLFRSTADPDHAVTANGARIRKMELAPAMPEKR
jgi:hypothetical protein